GPRYLVEALPLLFILLCPVLERWSRIVAPVKIMGLIAVLFSLFIQTAMIANERAFVTWNTNPHINNYPRRLWNFWDPPFARSLSSFRLFLFSRARFFAAFEDAQRELFETD